MKKITLVIIKIHERFISAGLKSLFGGGCRFNPTCSVYAQEAIVKFGLIKGLSLSAGRLARCHPLGGAGHDPIP